MRKTNKRGLREFRMDVNFFELDAVKYVTVACGAAGVCVMLKLLTEIFKNGFWVKWGEDEEAMLTWEMHGMVGREVVGNVVKECLKRGVFDLGLYEAYGILTSEEIQRKYMQGTRGRKEVEIEEEYWLLEMPRNAVTVGGGALPESAGAAELPELPKQEDAEEPAKAASSGKVRVKRVFMPPTEEEVVRYFVDSGYKEEAARRAWRYYENGGWTDSRGNPVKNWKQKVYVNWMIPENKITEKKPEYEGCIDF